MGRGNYIPNIDRPNITVYIDIPCHTEDMSDEDINQYYETTNDDILSDIINAINQSSKIFNILTEKERRQTRHYSLPAPQNSTLIAESQAYQITIADNEWSIALTIALQSGAPATTNGIPKKTDRQKLHTWQNSTANRS